SYSLDCRVATILFRSRRRLSVRAFSIMCVVALLVFVCAGSLFVQVPQPYQPLNGPTSRIAKGKVDFSGVWEKPYVFDMIKDGRNQKGFAELPFTPWG